MLDQHSSAKPARQSGQRAWLILALASFFISSIFSLLIVLSRVPYVRDYFGVQDLFEIALVLHVDFGIVIWFLSIAVYLWCQQHGKPVSNASLALLAMASVGVLLLLATPLLVDSSKAILSDYILVLEHPVFYLGLLLFISIVLVTAIQYVWHFLKDRQPSPQAGFNSDQNYALLVAALSFMAAVMVFGLDWLKADTTFRDIDLFHRVFWGAGHLLQLSYMCTLLFVWLDMASGSAWVSIRQRPSSRWLLHFILVLVACSLLYSIFFVGAYRDEFYTVIMALGGLAFLPLVWAIIRHPQIKIGDDWRGRNTRHSALLFLLGLIVGACIHSNNALVPAHYHCMIGSVTLGYFGLVYHQLIKESTLLGNSNAIIWQNRLYLVGVVLFVLGLIVANLPRKSNGLIEMSSWLEVAGRSLMGLGGLIALFASLYFVVIVVHLWRQEGSEPVIKVTEIEC